VFCPNCGVLNEDTDRFCKSCGYSLEEYQAPATGIPRAPVQPQQLKITRDFAPGTYICFYIASLLLPLLPDMLWMMMGPDAHFSLGPCLPFIPGLFGFFLGFYLIMTGRKGGLESRVNGGWTCIFLAIVGWCLSFILA
jgi:hypothetical protein